jgi:ankyrin repeat protein
MYQYNEYSYSFQEVIQMSRKSIISAFLSIAVLVFLSASVFASEIHWAAKEGMLDLVKKDVGQNPSLVNAKDSKGDTPLHKAAENGCLQVVEFLIEKGAPVNAINEEGETPIFEAAEKGYADVVRALISHGAEVNIREESGETPLHKAAEEGRSNVVKILVASGAKIDAKDYKNITPLDCARKKNYNDTVQLLLELQKAK